MSLTRTTNILILKWLGILLVIGIIVTYAISRTFDYAQGPEILIFEPVNGSIATTSLVTITGQALRINKIYLNDNPISVDEEGYWNENIIVFKGLNRITVKAEDQFGRKISKGIELVGEI